MKVCLLNDSFPPVIDGVVNVLQNYAEYLSKDYDADVLEEAVAMKNVYKQANRIKCATIGWKAIQQMIEESEAGHE